MLKKEQNTWGKKPNPRKQLCEFVKGKVLSVPKKLPRNKIKRIIPPRIIKRLGSKRQLCD